MTAANNRSVSYLAADEAAAYPGGFAGYLGEPSQAAAESAALKAAP